MRVLDVPALLAELAATVGSQHVSACAVDNARYVEDGRGSTDGLALAVVRPATEAEVSCVMRIAHAYGLHVVVQGARTGLVGAAVPDASGEQLVLSMERLANGINIDVANRTAIVDAGVLLSALNTAAATHGLFFPIDLGADPTLGGMIAANTGGARLLRYGDVRRNLLALNVVLADEHATQLTLGKGLWKDNSKLDIKQLFVGSSGALGVITGATLALQPLPANRITAYVALNNPECVPQLLTALETQLGALLTAFEGMSPSALRSAFVHFPSLRDPFPGEDAAYTLLIELSGGHVLDVEKLEELFATAIEPFMNRSDNAILDIAMDRGDRLWSIRHAIPQALRLAGTVIACDIAVPRGSVMRFRRTAAEHLRVEAPGLQVQDFGHIGDGGIHFNMVWPRGSGTMPHDLAHRARDLVFKLATGEFGGSFSAEHGVGPRNTDWYIRDIKANERSLAGRIQNAIPNGLGRVDYGYG